MSIVMYSDKERGEMLCDIERHKRFIDRLIVELKELDDVKLQNAGNPHFEATRISRQRRLDSEREILVRSEAVLKEWETRALAS
jgi:hypothetical protein